MTRQHIKALILLPFMVDGRHPGDHPLFHGFRRNCHTIGPGPWNVLIVAGSHLLPRCRPGTIGNDGLVLFASDRLRDFGSLESPATPGRRRPVPPCPQSNDLGRLSLFFWPRPCSLDRSRSWVLWVIWPRRELDLHPVGGRTGLGEAVRGRVPPVQATRSSLDSTSDAVLADIVTMAVP